MSSGKILDPTVFPKAYQCVSIFFEWLPPPDVCEWVNVTWCLRSQYVIDSWTLLATELDGCIGRNSIQRPIIAQAVSANDVATRQCKRAALISRIFYLNFCTVRRNGDSSSIFICVNCYMTLPLASCILAIIYWNEHILLPGHRYNISQILNHNPQSIMWSYTHSNSD